MDKTRTQLKSSDLDVFDALIGEEQRQIDGVEMIPSENYTYPEVLTVLGSVFTNKYAEGYPGRRYYGGQTYTDAIELLAQDRAKTLFKAEHANVQPLSGSPMNQAVYFALLKPGDTVLAMDLTHGGHLTHGSPVSHMGKVFNFVRYKTQVDQNGAIDFEALLNVALKHRPKMILAGHSSYPRDLDYAAFKAVADQVGALTMADISHVGGLVAAGVQKNPIDAGFDIVTTTTHKTLRGPRGGLILCRSKFKKAIDASVFPGLQGGPHMNNVAGAAITFKFAATPEFRQYAEQVLKNATALANSLVEAGTHLITGGTENHLMVLDTIKSFGLDGQESEKILDTIGVTTNKQLIPDDERPAMKPSGLRLGTPACTTRGMDASSMTALGSWIFQALRNPEDSEALKLLRQSVLDLCHEHPVPSLTV